MYMCLSSLAGNVLLSYQQNIIKKIEKGGEREFILAHNHSFRLLCCTSGSRQVSLISGKCHSRINTVFLLLFEWEIWLPLFSVTESWSSRMLEIKIVFKISQYSCMGKSFNLLVEHCQFKFTLTRLPPPVSVNLKFYASSFLSHFPHLLQLVLVCHVLHERLSLALFANSEPKATALRFGLGVCLGHTWGWLLTKLGMMLV